MAVFQAQHGSEVDRLALRVAASEESVVLGRQRRGDVNLYAVYEWVGTVGADSDAGEQCEQEQPHVSNFSFPRAKVVQTE